MNADGTLKILMLNHEFPPVGGGASPVTFELCKQLASMGHHVDVVTMRYGTLPKFERVDGFNIYRTPALRKRPNICYTYELATYVPGALFKTLSLAKKDRYDVIHCHFMVPGAALAYIVSKLTGIPFVVTCHGTDVPGHNPDRFGHTHKLIAPVWSFIAKRADMITSPSSFLKEKILRNAAVMDVEIVPNGIYFENFHPGQKTTSILMCSRMFKFKGFQYAIEALAQLRPDWKINVIGEGPYLTELKQQAAKNKLDIKFWGWLDKSDPRFYELFNTSSIFVFPSEAENFPSVLLEAMSAGMAVITSSAGGCPEVVGSAGLLVPPRDVTAIKQQLSKLIESEQLRNEMADAARTRSQQFSWPAVAAQYVECYKKVMAGK